MEFNKKIIIFLAILLVGLLVIGTATAADIASENNAIGAEPDSALSATNDNEKLEINENNNVLTASPKTFTDLNNTINGNSNKTIDLYDDYAYNDGTDSAFKEGIVIGREVSIDGHGITINGSMSARIFKITTNDKVTFKNITFTHGYFYSGFGGAIYGGSSSSYTAINCTFSGNHADSGGTMYRGTAINCTFSDNYAPSVGGAMDRGTAINCTFSDNNAHSGGAMEGGTAINCTFSNNSATDGGAMFKSTAIGCTFSGNKAKFDGGAMDSGTAIGCTFSNNSATDGDGGAMDSGTAIGCTFSGNKAKFDGGAMYEGSEYLCIFENYAGDCYFTGQLSGVSASLSVSNTVFSEDEKRLTVYLTCEYQGEKYQIDNFNATISILQDGTWNDLHVLTGKSSVIDLQLGVYTANFTVKATNSEVKRDGVQLKVTQGTTFSDLNKTINGNTANEIDLYKNYKYNSTTDSEFTEGIIIDREVSIDGHGITIDGSDSARIFKINTNDKVTFKNITFTQGHLDSGRGGAIYGSDSSSYTAINCTFSDNYAGTFGGAMYYGTAIGCTFSGNYAPSVGGAMSDGTAINCTFSGNRAGDGGAMEGGTAIGCTFSDNKAYLLGGAMRRGTAIGCTFSGNSATDDGDAMHRGSEYLCIFENYAADCYNTGQLSGVSASLSVSNTVFSEEDEKRLTVYLTCEYQGEKYRIDNFNATISILQDGAWNDLHVLTGKSSVLDLQPGVYLANFTVKATNSEVKRDGVQLKFTDGTTFSDLNKTINGNTANEIDLYKNYKYNSTTDSEFTEGIIIDRAVTINGNGHTINATGKARIFKVTADNVLLNNITFTNGNFEGIGGAICFSSNGTVTNCNFVDNKATGSNSKGGAVYITGEGTVTNCNFTANQATEECGTVYFNANGTLRNCNFVNNKADNIGVIRINVGSVEYCNFVNNSASKYGVIWIQGGNIEYCNFVNNSAAAYYGAVAIGNGNVTNCNFTGNHAKQGDSGAVSFWGNGNVTNCNFTANSASESGGAVSFMNPGNVVNSNFVSNKAISGSGGAIKWDNDGNLFNCNFTNNTANSGGAIYIYSGNLTYCNFEDNNATTGSAINFVYTLANNVSNSRFLNNRANAEALEVTKNDNNITITFTGNDNLLNAIYSNDDVTFTNVTYWSANGIATTGSSAIKPSRSNKEAGQNITIEIYDSNNKLVENVTLRTNDTGQVKYDFIKLNNGYYTFKAYHAEDNYYTYTNMTGNFTLNSGLGDFNRLQSYINGADANSVLTLCRDYIYSIDNDTITDGIVIDKPLTIKGNGYTINAQEKTRIFNVAAADVVLENITFTNSNFDGNGGAIYFSSSGTVINCNFTYNSASFGGAIYFEYGYTGNVTNCNFTNNSANSGGAIYFSGYGTVINCNFTNNTAHIHGGAVYVFVTCNVTNCNFTGNKATGYWGDGGAIWMNSGTVTNCNFTDNKATGSDSGGGAVYFGNGNVTNCNFTYNSAIYGGAICFSSSGNVTNCNFNNNTANRGGAIYFFEKCSVKNCNFTGNNATTGSAIYFYWESATKTVSNSRFLNNRANAEALEVTKNDNNITITFTGNDNLLNAIYSNGDVTFTNVTYWSANGIAKTGSSPIKPSRFKNEAGQNITVVGVVNGNILNTINVTNEYGEIILEDTGDYYLIVRHDADTYYTEIEKTFTNMKYNVNVTSQTTNNRTVNITAKSNIYNEVMPGKLLFILPNGTEITANYGGNGTWWVRHTFDDYGDYKINASYSGLDGVTINNATISIIGDASVTAENIVTTVNNETAIGATTTPEGLKLTYVSADPNIADVDDSGNVTGKSAGSTTITITIDGEGKYYNNKTTIEVTVNLNDASVSANPISVDVGGNYTILPTTAPTGLDVAYSSVNSSIATVDTTGKVTGVSEGVTNITLTVGGDGLYAEYCVNVTVTVSKVPTSIDVASTAVSLKAGENQSVGATLNPSEAGELSYVSSNSTVAYVDNGLIIANRSGNANITVSFKGDSKYASAQNRTIYVSVDLAPASVSASDITLNVNSTEVISLATTPVGLEVEYVSADPSIAEVDVNGVVTSHKGGNTTVTITTKVDGKHIINSTTINVTVTKLASEISIADSEITLNVNGNQTSGAFLVPASGVLSYVSSNSTVVRVEDGIIFAKAEGTAVITVSYVGDDYYKAADDKTINVVVKLNDARVTADNIVINVNENVSIGAVTTPGNLKLTYESANSTVAEVDASGKVTGKAKGSTTITITIDGEGVYYNNKTTIDVTVNLNDASVSADPVEVYVGGNYTIVPTTSPAGLEVTYSSLNSSVATVDATGKVIGVSEGVTNITLTVGDDIVYAKYCVNVIVTVSKVPTSIDVASTAVSLKAGENQSVGATLNPFEAGKLSYVSSNSTVAYVEDGLIIANRSGYASITVSFAGDSKYAACENKIIHVSVDLAPASVSASDITLNVNGTATISPTTTPAGLEVEYVSADPSIAEVDANGIITSHKGGNTTVTITTKVDGIHVVNSTTINVTVNLNDARVSADPVEVYVGGNYTIVPTTSPAGLDVKYSSVNSSVATVDDSGKVVGVSEGVTNITLTVGDDIVYAKYCVNVTVTVSKVPTYIDVVNPTVSLVAGNNQSVGASLNPSEAGILSYVSSNSTVAYVEDGLIIANRSGNAVITVSFAGDSKYAASENKIIRVSVDLAPASVSASDITLNVNSTEVISLATTPVGLEVEYVSADPSIAEVDVNGVVTSHKGGNTTVTITTKVDGKHIINSTTINVTVTKLASEISIADSEITLNVNGNQTSGAFLVPASGVLSYVSSNSTVVRVEDGIIFAKAEGTAVITVSYVGDDYYKAADDKTINVVVKLNDARVTAENIAINVNENVSIGAVTTPGNLKLTYVSANSTVAEVDASGKVTGKVAGSTTITITIDGEGVYFNNKTTVDVTVKLNDASVSADDVVLNVYSNATISPTTTPAGLEVEYASADPGIAEVDANGVVTAHNAGNTTVTITTKADGIHAVNSTTIQVTVNKVNSSLIIDDVVLDYGDSVNVTVKAEGATGITARIGSSDVAVDNYTILISGLDAGTYTLSVTTIPDDNHKEVTRTATVTVLKQNATADIEMPANVTVGENSTVSVKLPADATGNVTVRVDGEVADTVPVVNGTADLTIPELKAGNHTVEIAYSGDDNYEPVSETAELSVSKLEASENVTVPTDVRVGDNSTVEIRLPADATGNVTVKVDGEIMDTVPVTNGNAEVSLSSLSAGNHTVELTYSGDDRYDPVTQTALISISKNTASENVTIPSNITVGDNSTVQIKLPSDATGDVTLKVDGEVVDIVPVVNGTADLTIPELKAGNHTVEIIYSGDGKYDAVTKSTEITVSKKEITPDVSVPSNITVDDSAIVNVKLPNDATGNVTLSIDGQIISTVPVENGTASVKMPKLSAGSHAVEIAYSGDDKYASSAKTTTVSVNKDPSVLAAANVTATYNTGKNLVVTLTDGEGNPIANAEITVNLNGAKNYTTDENGKVSIPVGKLTPKTYTAKISFKGNDKYAKSSTTAKVVVKKAKAKITAKTKSFKKTTKPKKYTIKLTYKNGKPIKYAKVSLKVKGKIYNATTNKYGKATFKITKLNKKGTYKAVIKYDGKKYKASKKVTLKVKTGFKTVSKYSKNYSMVKKIQRALKHKGFYKTYDGCYLMVDGDYNFCTQLAVKEFQKSRGLKVTGSVDYGTAKKLEIV